MRIETGTLAPASGGYTTTLEAPLANASRVPREVFSRNAGIPARGASGPWGAVVSSPRRGQWRRLLARTLPPFSLTQDKAPRRVSTVCARPTRSTLGRHPRRASPRDAGLQVPHL